MNLEPNTDDGRHDAVGGESSKCKTAFGASAIEQSRSSRRSEMDARSMTRVDTSPV
jgi:hypothetical protein